MVNIDPAKVCWRFLGGVVFGTPHVRPIISGLLTRDVLHLLFTPLFSGSGYDVLFLRYRDVHHLCGFFTNLADFVL